MAETLLVHFLLWSEFSPGIPFLIALLAPRPDQLEMLYLVGSTGHD